MNSEETSEKGQEMKTCPYCFEQIKAEAVKCRWCRSTLNAAETLSSWSRNLPGRKIFGVCSMLAVNTSVPVLAWRVLFVILTLYHGLGLIAYLAVWLLTPYEKNGRSPIERIIRACRIGYRTIQEDQSTTDVNNG